MATIFKKHQIKEKIRQINFAQFNEKLAIVTTWHDAFKSGRLQSKTETQCEQAFNNDFFIKLLGYAPFPNIPYTIDPKASTDVSGQHPDAVLGYFDNDTKHVSAVVEIKDVNTALDRPQRRQGNLSPIQQAFKYKPQYKECNFVIATNFYEIRLFQDNQLDYEKFTLESLTNPADDYFELKRFILLLGAENFVSKHTKSNTEEILSEIRIDQEQITKEFYKDYSEIRYALMRDIWRNNEQKRDIHLVTDKAQKILDRIVFTSFCEDTGLLPDNILNKVFSHAETSYLTIWDTLKGFFKAVDLGSVKLGIPDGYNGGLFHEDKNLDSLIISDEACKLLGSIGKYDFENELTVTVLGHVFEQSITDLENIKNKVNPDDLDQISRRKKEGIYYTPEKITDYMVQNSVGVYLRENEERIFNEFKLNLARTDESYSIKERQALQKYQEFLQHIKVIDPACGSGGFLVKAFDYLLEENRRVGNLLGGLFDQDTIYRDILKNNIYGVDLNEESVRITQLSLWLKTAQSGKKLTYLDKNIRCGNSLISDKEIVDEKAFSWKEQFPDVFEQGGFDVVIMNPPYVDSESMKKYSEKEREYLANSYELTVGNWDLYVPFIEKSFNILKNGGYLSFITPDKWITKDFGTALRKRIFPYILNMSIAGREIFTDAKVDSLITTLCKTKINELITYRISESGFQRINKINKANIKEPYLLDMMFSTHSNIIQHIDDFNLKLLSLAECENACATSDAYKLKPLIVESQNPLPDQMKIVNTGTISKYNSRWGFSEMKYLGSKYLFPVISREQFKKYFGNSYFNKSVKSKIIIKGLTLLDACIDEGGTTVPGKSTLLISASNSTLLYFLLGFINSSLPIFYIRQKYASASYNGGINFSKDMINNLPIPTFKENIIDEVAKNTKTLQSLNSKLNLITKELFSLINSIDISFNLKWSMNEWWTLAFDDFIHKFHLNNMSIDKKEECYGLFTKYSAEAQVLSQNYNNIYKNIDNLIINAYGLGEEEQKLVESE